MIEAGTAALAADDAIHKSVGKEPTPVNDSPQLLNLLNAGYRQTLGSWKNLTATTASTVCSEFADRMDRAWLQVSSGAFDYNTAIRRAVDDLADSMKFIRYPSGHKDTLEVAVRRCVLTGVNQTAGKLQMARMEEMGCEYVEVTAHEGARPTHAVWQGKVYHVGGECVRNGEHYADFAAATGYGTGDGLCGWNCRHNFYPFYPGISQRAYTDERLEELNRPEIEYRGKKYTRYEISQMQRAKERTVRKYKRRFLAESEAGLDASTSAAKLKAARQDLKQFIRATGSKEDSARVSVHGFGRSAAGKAAWAAKKKNDPNILHQKNRGQKVWITDIALQKVQLVAPQGADEQTALFIQQTHKDLLTFAKEQNNSNEVACLVDLQTLERSNFVKGDQTSVDVESAPDAYHWMRTKPPRSIMLCHNHPGLSYFSMQDIRKFLQYDSIGAMSVVTNQGKVWVISKTDRFDRKAAYALLGELSKIYDKDIDTIIDKFTKDGYNGVERL